MFRLAAELGEPAARLNLSVAYAKGQGVPQDYVKAHMWSSLAGNRGYGKQLARAMSPEQIEAARKLAQEWRPKK